ncbi:TerB family tellurite resistance protein [Cyanobium sp. N5-Cardenillas]|uniref:tellurite resistance TerB family protein n=1 Tax=Cyanobium sp. N5-Cardenillas TaxID=2823720 RepID=UPI0021BC6BCF|nr:TerB family tellurite resistance protein [Cyanobium sp. N5-Cardenillas]MCP9786983.1 TerB family tellurite resistance protein [Cyanobium sp. N5-Cardenillas]
MAELTAAQAALLRIVCTVAWADGECSTAERELLAEQVATHLHGDSPSGLGEAQLEAFLAERLPVAGLDALVSQLSGGDARQLALKLSYMMVRVGRRSPAEPSINAQERVAYRHLVELLGLDDARIQEIEWAAEADLPRKQGLAQLLAELTAGWRSPDDGRGPT